MAPVATHAHDQVFLDVHTEEYLTALFTTNMKVVQVREERGSFCARADVMIHLCSCCIILVLAFLFATFFFWLDGLDGFQNEILLCYFLKSSLPSAYQGMRSVQIRSEMVI